MSPSLANWNTLELEGTTLETFREAWNCPNKLAILAEMTFIKSQRGK